MTMDISLQIRKLPPSHITQLSTILEFSEQWKKLMAVIPNKLEKGNFHCFINRDNPAKYNADHMRLIELATVKYKKTGTEILLDEWGCSGRVLPSVGHLLHLLLKAELYRAADYVSERILCSTSIERPSLGPAAKIPVNINGNLEENLNEMNYSSSLIDELIVSSFNNNLDYDERSCVPKIVVTPDADDLAQSPSFQEEQSMTNNIVKAMSNGLESLPSDIISSPAEIDSNEHMTDDPYAPQFSVLLANPTESPISCEQSIRTSINASSELNNSYDQSEMPNLSVFNLSDSPAVSGHHSNISSSNFPNLSVLNCPEQLDDFNGNQGTLVPSENSYRQGESHDNLIPDFSRLNQSENVDSSTENGSTLLPSLSGLNHSANSESLSGNGDSSITKSSSLNQFYKSSKKFIPSFNDSSTCNNNSDLSGGPDISGLMQTSSKESDMCVNRNLQESSEITHINTEEQETDDMPNLNLLMTESSRLTVSTFDSSKSRKCNSPLPNLILTTHLPHYTYEKLKSSTNDFNEDAYNGLIKTGRLLGSGAFGKVFLATGVLQEPVAVKKILLGNVEVVDVDDRITKQFINEVEVLSKFKHENLVSLLGYSCDGCTYCLLYEFIPGGTLKDRLQSKDVELTWQKRLSIALGTAKAITYLHTAFSSPLIHRDVKTANILLDHSYKPKLGDFGITTLLDNQSMDTTTMIIGTSAYMAPEAMRGDISVKCDSFSFGVVLLELLTSLAPFDENRDGHDLITHVEETCEDSIAPLLDTSIGSWSISNVNFGDEIFLIARQCIEEKKKRPIMVDISEQCRPIEESDIFIKKK